MCIKEDHFVDGEDGQDDSEEPAAPPDQQPGAQEPAATPPEHADNYPALTPSPLLWSELGASCSCSVVRVVDSEHEAEREVYAWAGFVCHCSMCRQAERRAAFGGGVPWVAVPRLRWEGTALSVRRSSEFGTRGACGACGAELFIRYDCELHTDWVHADVLRLASASSQLQRRANGAPSDDGGW